MSTVSKRRSFWVLTGEKAAVNSSTGEPTEYYPIPVPASATSVTITITPSTQFHGDSFWTLANGTYTRMLDPGWKQGSFTHTFAAGAYQYLAMNCKYDSGGSSYPVEPTDMVIEFA
jgi:hypothetical protein